MQAPGRYLVIGLNALNPPLVSPVRLVSLNPLAPDICSPSES